MKPLLGILNRSRRKEMIIAGRQELHLVGWRTVAISKVEAVGRTVVAWRWSIVHLIRHIWPGRALCENSCLIGRLILLLLLGGLLLHFFPVSLLFSVCSFRLEHLDLAACRVQVFCVFTIFILLKGVNLHPERNPLLSSMFPWSKFCADTMYLNEC